MTFVLVSVVLETAVNKKSATIRAQAPMAIGFAVFTAHAVSQLPTGGVGAKALGGEYGSGNVALHCTTQHRPCFDATALNEPFLFVLTYPRM